jgi:ketosteroid isomerase-like protein
MDTPQALTEKQLVQQHWDLANAQDWAAFARLLAPQLVYTVPQTRERIVGAAGYLDFFRTWPQPWRAEVLELLGETGRVCCHIAFHDAQGVMTGLALFGLQNGLITSVTDYWPEAYEPPPRHSPHVQRY